jgi:2-polyprenyl-3-methyl-5-hydroxy-6-metoxy-1,4-benzoquinol methylase
MAAHRSVALGYDAIAPEYDAHLASDPVAGYMRAKLHTHFARVFHAGDHVLDLTAGTGADACFLATQGVQVTALDISPGMIAQLQRVAASQAAQIEARLLAAECLSELDSRDFDGAISTFAGLNTIEDMPRLARNLAERLKPHGHVILHALNTFCFWEWAAHLDRTRRTEVRIGGHNVPHRLYDPFRLWRDAFALFFDLQSVYALSVIAGLPLVRRFRFADGLLFALDSSLGRVFPTAGDFFVIDLEKR